MQEASITLYFVWATLSYSVQSALAPWGKVPMQSLSIGQRILSLLLAVASLPFGLWLLWRAYRLFGFGHAMFAFLSSWIGGMLLMLVVGGIYSIVLSKLVSDPESRMREFHKFRYGQFWIALPAAVFFGYQLFQLYR